MTVTKADLINQVHTSNPRMTKRQARTAVETILNTIKTNLENGAGVLLSGFGKFNVNAKPARKGRNPKTGESLTLGAIKDIHPMFLRSQ
jgi:nucleoid DNA-binding protein